MARTEQELIQQMKSYLESRFDYYMGVFQDMVKINSFTENIYGIDRLSSYTASVFKPLGFSSRQVQSVNPLYGKHLILTRNGSSKKAIGCVSHLDTVFTSEDEKKNNFTWRIAGDRIYGPGTNDIKGGTILMLMILDVLLKTEPEKFNKITWILLFDASEETESDDFGELCIEQLKDNAAACLVFEGGKSLGNKHFLVTSRKGRAVFRIITDGNGTHAGTRHKAGASAIEQMADVIKIISGFTDYSKELTFNAGVISGGTVLNRVPHFCESLVEMRAFSLSIFEEGISKILSLNGFSSVSSADGTYSCKTRIELLRKNPSWPVNEKTGNIFRYWQEAADLLGLSVVQQERGGLSDGNFIWNHIPAIDGLGPDGENSHCSESLPDGSKDQEYALRSSFIPKTLLNSFALLKLIG